MFNINGVDYPSWDQVPEELRRQLAALPDADGNGIPDLIEGTAATLPDQVVRTQTYVETSSRSFVLNSPEDFAALPPDVRALLDGPPAAGIPQDAPPQDALAAPARPQDAPVVQASAVLQDRTAAKPSWLRRVLGG